MNWHNALPFLFILSGLGLASNTASPLSFNVGILLMLIACLIWMKRLSHH